MKAWGEKLKEDQEFSWGHAEFEISLCICQALGWIYEFAEDAMFSANSYTPGRGVILRHWHRVFVTHELDEIWKEYTQREKRY